MALHIDESFSDNQIQAIVSFQGKLIKLLDRNISLAEAIINWIALGYAEDYRSGFITEHNNAAEKAEQALC